MVCLLTMIACLQIVTAQDETLRLALIYPPEAAPIGDLLTTALSKQEGITLLEREQIHRVFEEASLARAQSHQEWGEIGQLLGAEGLIVFDIPPGDAKSFTVSLIWAEHGIIVDEFPTTRKSEEAQSALEIALPQIHKSLRKLGELRRAGKSAVAMHLKGVFADSDKDSELREELSLLLSQRMINEHGWVVVDRRGLTDAVFETELDPKSSNDSLIPATHRLTLGFSKNGEILKIRGQLDQPGGPPKRFEVAGNMNEPSALAESFMTELLQAMGMAAQRVSAPWDSIQEAKGQMDWATKQYSGNVFGGGYPREWYEASSAAWALGLREPDVAWLRAFSLARWAWPDTFGRNHNSHAIELRTDQDAMRRMLHALDLLRTYWALYPDSFYRYFTVMERPSQVEDILINACHLLWAIQEQGVESIFTQDAPRLRRAIRGAMDELSSLAEKAKTPLVSENLRKMTLDLIVRCGPLWEENYADAQTRLETALLSFRRTGSFEHSFTSTSDALQHGNAGEHNERSEHPPFLFPRSKMDEAECLRRGLEIIDKLQSSPHEEHHAFAQALRLRLKDKRPSPIAAETGEDLSRYTGRTPMELKSEIDRYDPFKSMDYSKQVDLILQLLKERKPDEFLKPDLLKVFWFAHTNGLPPDLDLRAAQALDEYWTKVNEDSPLARDRTLVTDHTPLSQGQANNKYAGQIAASLSHLRQRCESVDSWLGQRYPERVVLSAFPVNHFWFSRHWKPYADLRLSPLDGGIDSSERATTAWNSVLSDGRNLFIFGYEGPDSLTATGVWMVSPAQLFPQKVYAGPNLRMTGSSVNQKAIDGWFFFPAVQPPGKPEEVKSAYLYACRPNQEPVTKKFDEDPHLVPEVIGYLEPYAYVLLPRVGGERRLYRWNLEENTIQLVADGARRPAVNVLDDSLDDCLKKFGNAHLIITKLPDGKDGLLFCGFPTYFNKSFPAFSMDPESGEVNRLGNFDGASANQPLWAAPFLKAIEKISPRLVLESKDRNFDLIVQHPGNITKSLYSKAQGSVFSEAFPGNLFHLAQFASGNSWPLNSPINFAMGRMVFPFSIGDMQGSVLLEQLMGREKFSNAWLVFFESDGLRYIPLHFELKPDEVTELQNEARTQNGGNEPSLRTKNALFGRPCWNVDFAWGLEDALVISVERINALWFLSRDELQQARRRAVKFEL